MSAYLWVALGGALGSVARYWMTNAIAALTGPRFPWGTIIINVLGSFVIGLFAYLTTPVGRVPVSFEMRAFVLVGICGGLTTFSSFSLQTYNLIAEGRWLSALSNIVFSTGLSFGCVALGWQLAQAVNF